MTEPYMKFYPGDYLADTLSMTLEEQGAYTRLLFIMWRAGGWIDNDDKRIARMLSVTSKKWAKLKENIIPLFTINGDQITQKRLLFELKKAQEKRTKKVSSGRAGGEAKARNNKKTDLANATNSLKQNASECSSNTRGNPEPELYKEKGEAKASPKKKEKFSLPEWIPIEDWQDYLEMRQRIRKPMTDAAKRIAVTDLEKLRENGHDPGAVLKQSVFNSWQGLFKIKEDGNAANQHTPGNTNSAQRDTRDPAKRASDIGSEIKRKRRETAGLARSTGSTDRPAVASLRQPENLRGQGTDDGISGANVPSDSGRISYRGDPASVP